MNKKGFTLIELIAIIIIISIIMIVSFSSLTRTLKKTKLKEVEDFKTKVASAAQIYVETELMRHETFNTGTYMKIGIDELLNNGYIKNDIEVLDKCTFENVKIFTYKNYDKTITYYVKCDDDYDYYTNGMPIYFNPVTGLMCDDYIDTNSNTGNVSGCMKWYTFKDNKDSNTVNMILDHNTTAVTAYNSNNVNTSMKEVATFLASNTATWNSGLNARLITADEVANITGNISFNSTTTASSGNFHFDSNTTSVSSTCTSGDITGCRYGWLYDRTSTSCKTYGCLNNADNLMTGAGYWTSNKVNGSNERAWYITGRGSLGNGSANEAGNCGVRPVITISKDLLQ